MSKTTRVPGNGIDLSLIFKEIKRITQNPDTKWNKGNGDLRTKLQ